MFENLLGKSKVIRLSNIKGMTRNEELCASGRDNILMTSSWDKVTLHYLSWKVEDKWVQQ